MFYIQFLHRIGFFLLLFLHYYFFFELVLLSKKRSSMRCKFSCSFLGTKDTVNRYRPIWIARNALHSSEHLSNQLAVPGPVFQFHHHHHCQLQGSFSLFWWSPPHCIWTSNLCCPCSPCNHNNSFLENPFFQNRDAFLGYVPSHEQRSEE